MEDFSGVSFSNQGFLLGKFTVIDLHDVCSLRAPSPCPADCGKLLCRDTLTSRPTYSKYITYGVGLSYAERYVHTKSSPPFPICNLNLPSKCI